MSKSEGIDTSNSVILPMASPSMTSAVMKTDDGTADAKFSSSGDEAELRFTSGVKVTGTPTVSTSISTSVSLSSGGELGQKCGLKIQHVLQSNWISIFLKTMNNL